MRSFIGYLLIVILVLAAQQTPADGVWFQTPEEVKALTRSHKWKPSLIYMKGGVFNSSGNLTPTPHSLDKLCATYGNVAVWVTHRLQSPTSLTIQAGEALATDLNQLLKKSCVHEVELDVEPISDPKAILPFLNALRNKLLSPFNLRIAAPPISSTPLKGIYWKPEEALNVLKIANGLDVMLYDTGLEDADAYIKLLQNSFQFVSQAMRQDPSRTVWIGLPAYKDKTPLHIQTVENLSTVYAGLKASQLKELKVVCLRNFNFLFFSGWSMDGTDVSYVKKITEWKKEVCKP